MSAQVIDAASFGGGAVTHPIFRLIERDAFSRRTADLRKNISTF